MSDELTDDQVETMAWELETKMMEIRKDPRAALTAELAKIRAAMLAEYRADMDKRKADLAKHNAVTKLMRRSYILGYRRARAKVRREMDSLADDIAALQTDFHELELELNHAHALDDAIIERAMAPDESLH